MTPEQEAKLDEILRQVAGSTTKPKTGWPRPIRTVIGGDGRSSIWERCGEILKRV